MAFNGVVTPNAWRYLGTSSTSTAWSAPVPNTLQGTDLTYYRTTRRNPITTDTEDTRCRGLALYPFCDHANVAADDTFGIQVIGWRKVTERQPDYDPIEWRPTILWRGIATIDTSLQGLTGGVGAAVQFIIAQRAPAAAAGS